MYRGNLVYIAASAEGLNPCFPDFVIAYPKIEGVKLTAEQALAVERAIAGRDKRNTELAEQVQALKANPAEKSQVVVDAPQQTAKSPFDVFADKVNNAKKLFNQVP